MKLEIKKIWIYFVIGLIILLTVITIFDGYMDLRIDKKLGIILLATPCREATADVKGGLSSSEVCNDTTSLNHSSNQTQLNENVGAARNQWRDYLVSSFYDKKYSNCAIIYADCKMLIDGK